MSARSLVNAAYVDRLLWHPAYLAVYEGKQWCVMPSATDRISHWQYVRKAAKQKCKGPSDLLQGSHVGMVITFISPQFIAFMDAKITFKFQLKAITQISTKNVS